MWRTLRAELHPAGFELVTVALDTGGVADARRWIEAARPDHPSLIDQAHLLDSLLGIVNVPSGIWIDESGTIVRPPETAYPRRPPFLDRPISASTSPLDQVRVAALHGLRIDSDAYIAALRDWIANGAASRYALSPDEVIARSRPQSKGEATAAAHFALAQHLHLAGRLAAAVPHFRQALHFHPENWTYKRQAWRLAERHPELPGYD
nr:TlpA family protein disulfide reductase [Chloroflexota bacterium]